MLNRRILRVKVMQSIYAFKQSKESNYELAVDQIKEEFAEELSIIGKDHKEQVAEKERLVLEYLAHNHEDGTSQLTSDKLDEKMIKIGADAVSYYRSLVQNDKESFRTKMLSETEKLYFKYLKFLQYLIDLSDYAQSELEQKVERGVKNIEKDTILHNILSGNMLIEKLNRNFKLTEEIEKHKIKRAEDIDRVKEWLRILKKEESFMAFADQEKSFERDKTVARYLLKDFMFKHDMVEPVFEEEDINWTENKTILKSMLVKTIKSIEEGDVDLELLSISKNWDEDKVFFEELYKHTLQQERDYVEIIGKNSKKWAKERMARVDSILLSMALTEMVNFPNIPVKVTINEFIEISKMYSTPKSWQFINGILDAVSDQMMKSGQIRKSGRGLIDNK
ncbi:transcription antitermination factor NusB [Limibacter armeniacum]|uniref:transcription antitermination factor NusB n=1 Tax=Limibacter armeniacum TaxID=466084 RepID=UPI002FE635ED